MNNMEILDYDNDRIIIKSAYGRVGQRYTIQPCKNPKTRMFPSCVRRVNNLGDMILSEEDVKAMNEGAVFIPENFEVTFESGKEFNLKNPVEKAQWEAIEHTSMIAKAVDQRDGAGNLVLSSRSGQKYSATELYVERPGLVTSIKVGRRQQIHDAETYIFSDPSGADGRLRMAKLLGRSMTNAPDADVKDYLLDIASKDPERIIKLYTGEDLPLRILFLDAKNADVIYSKNNVYMYADGIPLGGNVDAAINWMRDPRNSKMLQLIKNDVYGSDLEVTNQNAINKLKLD